MNSGGGGVGGVEPRILFRIVGRLRVQVIFLDTLGSGSNIIWGM